MKLHPGHLVPRCATCNKLSESGLDEDQFDITRKTLRSGLTKNFIRCKNGKNVLPSNRNFEYVEVSVFKITNGKIHVGDKFSDGIVANMMYMSMPNMTPKLNLYVNPIP